MQKMREQTGFTLPELLVSLLLTVLLLTSLASITFSFASWWKKGSGIVNLEQNMRVVINHMVNELKYTTGSVIFPYEGEESDNLELRNAGNYKTTRFYVAVPNDYNTIPTLYRYVKDDRAYTGGTVQLTEPSRVLVSSLKFKRINFDTIEIKLKMKDSNSGIEREIYTTVQCLNTY